MSEELIKTLVAAMAQQAQQNADLMRQIVAMQAAANAAPAAPAPPVVRAGFTVRELWKLYITKFGYKWDTADDKRRNAKTSLKVMLPLPHDPKVELAFGEWECSWVKASTMDEMRKVRATQKTEKYDELVSIAQQNREVSNICSWFSWAEKTDEPMPYPVRQLKGVNTPDEGNKKKVRMLPAQVDAFLAHPLCEPMDRALFLVLLDCGLREMEALNFTWNTFDHESGIFALLDDETKGGEMRTMQLTDRAREALLALPRTGLLVFWNSKPSGRRAGPGPYSPTYLYKRFRTILETAGVKGPLHPKTGEEVRITFHTLRHTFAYNERRFNKTPKSVVKKMLGHSTDSAFDRYGIPDDEEVLEACATRNRLINERKGPQKAEPDPDDVAAAGDDTL